MHQKINPSQPQIDTDASLLDTTSGRSGHTFKRSVVSVPSLPLLRHSQLVIDLLNNCVLLSAVMYYIGSAVRDYIVEHFLRSWLHVFITWTFLDWTVALLGGTT